MPRQWNRSTICRRRSAALWCWPPTRGTKGWWASWPPRLSEKYACPSFMIHLSGTVGKGSCRSWGGFNLFAALERCSDLLLDFGGHELAAGFTIDVANIPAFRQRMNQLVREYQGGGAPEVCLEIDAALTCPSRVTPDGGGGSGDAGALRRRQ